MTSINANKLEHLPNDHTSSVSTEGPTDNEDKSSEVDDDDEKQNSHDDDFAVDEEVRVCK